MEPDAEVVVAEVTVAHVEGPLESLIRSAKPAVHLPPRGEYHCLEHGFHKLTLGPDEFHVGWTGGLAAPARRAAAKLVGVANNAWLGDRRLLDFAFFAQQRTAKAHNSPPVIP